MRTPFTAAVGEIIQSAMSKRGVSRADLAEHLDLTYEHARRMVRGESIPPRHRLRRISEYLKIPLHDLEKQTVSDHIRLKHGAITLELSKKNPELEPIERAWVHLTDEQKASIVTMVQVLAQQNLSVKK